MPFNGSGVYTLPAADTPAVAQTLIESTKYNNVNTDLATALSTCITKDGQTTATARIPFAAGISVTTDITTPSASFTAFAGATTLLTLGGTGASAVVAIPGTLEWSGTTAALTVAGGAYIAKKLKAVGAVDFGSTLTMTGKITATTAGIDVPTSALGTIYSDTYTPNFYTDGSGNVASHSVSVARYIRVGDVVFVSGYLEVDPTSTGVTQFELSLPVASNLASSSLSGTISDASYNDTGSVSADAATDRAAFLFIASNAGNHGMAYQFSYTKV